MHQLVPLRGRVCHQRHFGCHQRGDQRTAERSRRRDEARGDVAAEERSGADIWVGRGRRIGDQRAAKPVVLKCKACTGIYLPAKLSVTESPLLSLTVSLPEAFEPA